MIELGQYRDPWISEGLDDYIGFYNREFYCLDNFSAFQIEYDGIKYPCAEIAYQTQGFIHTDPVIADQIMHAPSAYEAKKIAHRHIQKRRADWDLVKIQIMEDILRAKLSQHAYVKKKLLETGNYMIVEDSPTDSFWGCGSDRNGQNHMGKLWMKLRDELRENLL